MARRRKNEKRQKSIRYFDYSLLFLIIFLLCFGLIMLYSTSSYYGSTRFNDAAYYVKRQMYASALGIVAMLFISRIPYKFWMQLSTLAYFVALVLCTAVIFVGTVQRDSRDGSGSDRSSSSHLRSQKLRLSFSLRRSSIKRLNALGKL